MMAKAHVIGMGRLGQHLSVRLAALGVVVTRFNRTPHPGALPLSNWKPEEGLDAVFLTVSDGAISEVAQSLVDTLPKTSCLIHHAGSVARDILPWPKSQTGVLWPPMTFLPDEAPDWPTLPMAVDSEHHRIQDWAHCIAPRSFAVNEAQRKHLHLGAVMLGNLTAAWIGTVAQHLQQMHLDPSILSPLVQASVDKALQGNALDTVTGPAARNDRTTLTAQAELLQSPEIQPQLALLHHHLTQSILAHHGHLPLPPFQTETRQD